MQNLENRILAFAAVALCVLMTIMTLLTNRVLDKACTCQNVIPIGISEIDKAIYENSKQIDSTYQHADTSVDGTIRELWQRYNSAGYDSEHVQAGNAAASKHQP